MKTHYFPLLVAGALFLGLAALQPLALGKPQTQDGQEIEVKLISKKKSIRAGEILEVRVEIWNPGPKPLFIEKAIYELCGPTSPLSSQLELGPPPKPQLRHGCAADCVYTAKDSFAKRFFYEWTILPPGDFYGTVVAMNPDSFPQLNTPGRWRLRGTYKSMGDVSRSACGDLAPIPDIKEQIKALPYEPWQGTVDTNTVWIEVAHAGGSSKVRK